MGRAIDLRFATPAAKRAIWSHGTRPWVCASRSVQVTTICLVVHPPRRVLRGADPDWFRRETGRILQFSLVIRHRSTDILPMEGLDLPRGSPKSSPSGRWESWSTSRGGCSRWHRPRSTTFPGLCPISRTVIVGILRNIRRLGRLLNQLDVLLDRLLTLQQGIERILRNGDDPSRGALANSPGGTPTLKRESDRGHSNPSPRPKPSKSNSRGPGGSQESAPLQPPRLNRPYDDS